MDVVTLGELLAEFTTLKTDQQLGEVGEYAGPFPAGAPAIFAVTVGRLGNSCGFIGPVGGDDFGEMIIDKLERNNVDVSKIKVLEDYTTGTSFVGYFADGSRKFIFHMAHAAPGQISDSDIAEEYLADAEFLHISGSTLLINEDWISACYRAIELAEENDVKISFDPNARAELVSLSKIRDMFRPIVESSDVLLPGIREAEILTGAEGPDDSGKELSEMSGGGTVLVKMGARGAMMVEGDEVTRIPPFPAEELDATGVGDSFDGGFISSLLWGNSKEKSARFASAVGSLSVTEMGGMGGIPTKDEAKNVLKNA